MQQCGSFDLFPHHVGWLHIKVIDLLRTLESVATNMAAPVHTYGPTCALHDTDQNNYYTHPSDSVDPPRVKAQFFYVSALPIDDPLSPLPPITEVKSTQSKAPPQPFSVKDNNALEEAWQGIQAKEKARSTSSNLKQPAGKRLGEIFRQPQGQPDDSALAESEAGEEPFRQNILIDSEDDDTGLASSLKEVARKAIPTKELEEREEHTKEAKSHKNVTKMPSRIERLQALRQEAVAATEQSRQVTGDGSRGIGGDPLSSAGKARLNEEQRPSTSSRIQKLAPTDTFFSRPESTVLSSSLPSRSDQDRGEGVSHPDTPEHHGGGFDASSRQPTYDLGDGAADLTGIRRRNTSGRPFARAPSHKNMFQDAFSGTTATFDRDIDERGEEMRAKASEQEQRNDKNVFVPVGVARLHLVELPDMMLKPIYWNPVNDIARVLRATWFYKNTMSPVEPDVANRLEIGYEDMRPWTTTWQDEHNSCVEYGAEAEVKVTRRLWPEDDLKPSRPTSSGDMKLTNDGQPQEQPLSEMPENLVNVAVAPTSRAKAERMYPNHSVVYVDGKNAQLLRPSLAPSVSKHRTPLTAIRKGRQIGIAVVRGFDRKAWDTLHPAKKMDSRTANAKVGAFMSQSGDAATRGRRFSCVACQMQEKQPAVTDLVLVIHGIGQKLSERMESYHFTHAINSFRRQVNVELISEAVHGTLRKDMGGIMVLPINWRLTLTFDEDGRPTSSGPKRRGPTENEFTLKDITPETLPAVRSLVSDVMLDIPYYLSAHKEKMVSAVVKEANRVYRLWCRNNPGFHGSGRVHIIAHSLGSAMALDILSQQPTQIPKTIDLKGAPNDKSFEFDTKSLFCCGSPAGFFLLLNSASLIPRKGRNKPGSEGEDQVRGLGGNAGTYGCLAVDNVYNIMQYNDPVAYHMNAAVDVDYAHSLKPGVIPSTRGDWFSSFSNVFKLSSTEIPTTIVRDGKTRPNMNKLPSTIEMNTHDFTREEIAEKRMYLLNDNGQIDFFLSSGGGPLEFQYLSMLSAHSSYWTLQDFVRFIVLEVGRSQGREGTLPVLRAAKKRIIKAGKIA